MMVICDHAHECDKECNHKQMHEHGPVCDWSGCTWQNPRVCVNTDRAQLIELVWQIKQKGLINELLEMLKEPRKRTLRAPAASPPPLGDETAISPVGARPTRKSKKEESHV